MTPPFSVPTSRGTTGGKDLRGIGPASLPIRLLARPYTGFSRQIGKHSALGRERHWPVIHPSIHPSSHPPMPITQHSTQQSTLRPVSCQRLEPVKRGRGAGMVGADPSHKPPFWGRRTSGTGWAGDREGQEPREKG